MSSSSVWYLMIKRCDDVITSIFTSSFSPTSILKLLNLSSKISSSKFLFPKTSNLRFISCKLLEKLLNKSEIFSVLFLLFVNLFKISSFMIWVLSNYFTNPWAARISLTVWAVSRLRAKHLLILLFSWDWTVAVEFVNEIITSFWFCIIDLMFCKSILENFCK